jgi:hypothetical protein
MFVTILFRLARALHAGIWVMACVALLFHQFDFANEGLAKPDPLLWYTWTVWTILVLYIEYKGEGYVYNEPSES